MEGICLEILISYCILFKPDVILVIIIGGYVGSKITRQERILQERIFCLFIQFVTLNIIVNFISPRVVEYLKNKN
jgi:hypothetical protein